MAEKLDNLISKQQYFIPHSKHISFLTCAYTLFIVKANQATPLVSTITIRCIMPEQQIVKIRNIREVGKALGNAIHKEADKLDLSGQKRTEFVVNALTGAIIGVRNAEPPDQELIDHLEVMVDMMSDVQASQSRKKAA